MNTLLRVLLVEDNPGDRDLIRGMLTETGTVGFSVEWAQRLSEAISRVKRGAIDLVLLSLELPDSVGLDTFTRLRAEAPGMPIIILTGDTNQNDAIIAVREGAQDHLIKGQMSGGRIARAIRYAVERTRAANELRASEERYRKLSHEFHALLDTLPDGIVQFSPDLKVIWANRSMTELLKIEETGLVGNYCYRTFWNFGQPCAACPVVRSFLSAELEDGTIKTPDGRHLELRAVPIAGNSGQVESVIEIVRDITEHRKLEGQLRHAQKMEGIGTLAGGIAHDFNNILSAIIGYGHVTLMKLPPDEPLRMNIENIVESADRAAALTQSLLAFSRKQITDRKPVDLNAILKKVEKFLVRVIGEDVAVHLTLDAKDLIIRADAGQLEQVFMNLATNARDAMPQGGSFTIETKSTELENDFIAAYGYGKVGSYAMITATDTGMGMNDETRKKIFEPFFTTKEVGKGTGLGLAVSYGIIKQNEGFINVYSEPGKGSTFRIYLPLVTAPAAEGRKIPDAEFPKGGTETILLAEDDANLGKLTKLVLEHMGYTVILAKDGEEAVARFMENKDAIQLLLFDIIMPKKNGREACDEIRKAMPLMPVIFASGYSLDMLRQKALIGDEDCIVSKPIVPRNLVKKVRDVLDGALYK